MDLYPLYSVVGNSNWIEKHASNYNIEKIQIPLSIFNEQDISFTYPDSMVSYWLGRDKPADYYETEYHCKIFTLSEVKHLIKVKGLSEDKWKTKLPIDVAPYFEAQIWNHGVLFTHLGLS